MRAAHRFLTRLVAVGALAVVGVAEAGEQVWHPTLEAGLEAAKRSQKPLLVVTVWKTGV